MIPGKWFDTLEKMQDFVEQQTNSIMNTPTKKAVACRNCKYYDYIGSCFRYPPKVYTEGTGFPDVEGYWWCGEYKEKE